MKREQPEKAAPSPAVAAAVDGIYRAARAAIARPLWRGDLEADWRVLEPPPYGRVDPEPSAPRAITGGSFGLAPRTRRVAAPSPRTAGPSLDRRASAAPAANVPQETDLAIEVDLGDLS